MAARDEEDRAEADTEAGYVIAVGNAFDGLTLYGDEVGEPFPDAGVAVHRLP